MRAIACLLLFASIHAASAAECLWAQRNDHENGIRVSIDPQPDSEGKLAGRLLTGKFHKRESLECVAEEIIIEIRLERAPSANAEAPAEYRIGWLADRTQLQEKYELTPELQQFVKEVRFAAGGADEEMFIRWKSPNLVSMECTDQPVFLPPR